jgi:crotonobetainyl-CoA:carnitine CoA-transferase CaiB-like acyl-CoA transferase
MARTRNEILEMGIAWGIPVAMVYTPEDVVKSEHFRAREYLAEVEHPVLGRMTQPGAPFAMSATPWRIGRPAPGLGQHNEEIRGRAGGHRKDVAAIRQEGATGDDRLGSSGAAKPPLDGVRICALTCFWAGPHATAYLGALGAEVIKVEAIQAVDGWRWPQIRCEKWWEKSGYWCGTNINQYGITLDLDQPRGFDLFKQLVAKSDVVIDNFPPRVMENFKLGYSVLTEIKPDIIVISMPGYGTSGPWRDFPGFAHAFDQVSGLAHITGYSDEGPMVTGPTADPMAGIHAAFAVQAALEYRRRTGRGQFIELSQLEVLTGFMGPAILDYVMNGRVWGRWGNRDPAMAPHNVYRCLEKNTWAVLAIGSDEEWRALCRAIGSPEWAEDKRFSTALERAAKQDEIDRRIEEWTSRRDPYEVMHHLQAAGVAAGAVTDAVRLDEEPHLREREFWVELDRDLVGKHPYPGFPVQFSEMSMSFRSAPTLGQHNDYVLRELLGLSSAELEELEREQIIGTEPLQKGLAI